MSKEKLPIDIDRIISLNSATYHYCILLVAIVIELFKLELSLNFLIFIIISFFCVIGRNILLNSIKMKNKIDEERKQWLYGQIIRLMKAQGYSSELINYKIRSLLEQLNHYNYQIELFNIETNTDSVYSMPDIAYAEKELIEMEQRISKSFVILVSAPIIFLALHFAFSFKTSYLVVNALLIFIIVEIITYETRNPYKLDGWGAVLNQITDNKNSIIADPYGTLIKLQNYFNDIYMLELSMLPSISKKTPVYQAIGVLFLALIEIDPSISIKVIEEFLDSAKDLPKVENIHKKKWRAYSSQFIFITTAIVFFSAILSSLAIITNLVIDKLQHQSNIPIVTIINPSKYAAEAALILTIIIIYTLSKPFLDIYKRKIMIVFWGIEYLCVMYSIAFAFEAISSTII